MIPPAFLDSLRERLPLSSVIGQHLRLIKAGREFKACCPFHHEKTPSFTVVDDKGFWHCHGCGAHGDHFAFVMRYQNLSFVQAVEAMAASAGMAMPMVEPKERQEQARRRDAGIIMEMACRWFQEQLADAEGDGARDYLAGRGLTPETIAEAQLGWAPADGQAIRRWMKEQRIDDADGLALGLVKEGKGGGRYGFFRGRVIFPIGDATGRIIGFGGRLIAGDGPKYINSPDTELFDKGANLYGLARARLAVRDEPKIIVVEGYMDVLALAQAGYRGAVAPLGTALTEAQIKRLWRLLPDDRPLAPILLFDGDGAGLRASERAARLIWCQLVPGRSAAFGRLPDGEDPASLLLQGRGDDLAQALASATPLADQVWRMETQAPTPVTPEDRAAMVARLRELLGSLAHSDVKAAYTEDFGRRLLAECGLTLKPFSGDGKPRSRPRPVAGRDNAGDVLAARTLWSQGVALSNARAAAAARFVGRQSLGQSLVPELAALPALRGAMADVLTVGGAGSIPMVAEFGMRPCIIGAMSLWSDGGGGKPITAVLVQYLQPDGARLKLVHPGTGEVLPDRLVVGCGRGAAVRLAPLQCSEQIVLAIGLGLGLRIQPAVWTSDLKIPVWVVPNLRHAASLVVPRQIGKITLVGSGRARNSAGGAQALAAAVDHLSAGGRKIADGDARWRERLAGMGCSS